MAIDFQITKGSFTECKQLVVVVFFDLKFVQETFCCYRVISWLGMEIDIGRASNECLIEVGYLGLDVT